MPRRKEELQWLVLGVDPGMSGAIVAIDKRGHVYQMIRADGTENDIIDAVMELRGCVVYCLIESVHSMPKQGVSSSFKFGESFGFLQGICAAAGLRRELITPQQWQKEIACRTGGDKKVSKRKAQQLFPGMTVTHRWADALLIAEVARRRAIKRKWLL